MGVTSASMDGMKIRRRTRMVNDVPMEIVYRGMSIHRLNKLNDIVVEAADAVYYQHYDRWDGWGHLTFAEQEELIDAEFRRLCQRAASKAGWHANKRNRNNKKEAVK